MSVEQISAGYRLERIYAAEEHYALVDAELLEDVPESPEEGARPFTLSWDWSVEGHRSFDVFLSVKIGPHGERLEEATVSMVGRFTALPGELTVPVESFITQHAPAIVMPYIREAISALTGRGFYGAFYLPPVNMLRFMQGLDRSTATGFTQLRENPEIATMFGISLEQKRLE